MRNLIIHRERALAAFALTYYCHVNRDRAAHLRELEEMEDPRTQARGDYGVRNGETIRIPMDEAGGKFFMGIYTQNTSHVSPEITVEPGTEDVCYMIVTDFDGERRLAFRILPAEPVEA